MRKPNLPEFADFDIEPEDYQLFLLLPVFAVAWADGKLQKQEVNNLLAAQNSFASLGVNPQHPRLDEWMKEPIRQDAAIKGINFLADLSVHEDFGEITIGRLEEVIRLCQELAKSAGGLLGVHAVSGSESKLIKNLQQVVENLKRSR